VQYTLESRLLGTNFFFLIFFSLSGVMSCNYWCWNSLLFLVLILKSTNLDWDISFAVGNVILQLIMVFLLVSPSSCGSFICVFLNCCGDLFYPIAVILVHIGIHVWKPSYLLEDLLSAIRFLLFWSFRNSCFHFLSLYYFLQVLGLLGEL